MKLRFVQLVPAPVVIFSAVFAVEPSPSASTNSREPANWVFDLRPKSLQSNPHLDLTVITELTEEGRKRPAASLAKPVYFVAQSAGYHRTIDAPAAEKTLPPDKIDTFVKRSLALGGFYPATPSTRPPTLVLVYVWGVHSRPPSDEALSADRLTRNLLDRARLVGGDKFAGELMEMFDQASAQAQAAPATSHLTVGGEAVAPVLGAEQLEFMSPINRFRDRSVKNEFLLEQVGSDVYYVTVSAYDHDALLKGRRVLLWRTRMTSSAVGVSQMDSFPTLIAAAAPYFGKEMTGPATLTPRAIPKGEVSVGTPVVVEGAQRGSEKSVPKK